MEGDQLDYQDPSFPDLSEAIPDVKVETINQSQSETQDGNFFEINKSSSVKKQSSLDEALKESQLITEQSVEIEKLKTSRSSEIFSSKSSISWSAMGSSTENQESITEKFNQIAKMNKNNVFKNKRHNTTALTRSILPDTVTTTDVENRIEQSGSVGELLDTFQGDETGIYSSEGIQQHSCHHTRIHSDEVQMLPSAKLHMGINTDIPENSEKKIYSLGSSGNESPQKLSSVDQESLGDDSGIGPSGLSASHKTSGVARSRSAASTLPTAVRKRVVPTDLTGSGGLTTLSPDTPPQNQGGESSGQTGSDEGAGSSTSLASVGTGAPFPVDPFTLLQLHSPSIDEISSPLELPACLMQNVNNISESVKAMLAKRYHIIRELIHVEKEYVKAMSILVNNFMIPLKHERILDDSQVDTIFYKIHEIMMYHVSFMNTLQSWETTNSVGDKIFEMFSRETVANCYCAFIENFSASEKMLENCLNTRSIFQRFCEIKTKESRTKLPLKALIVQPAQRIPRYELLIKRLLEYTPTDFSDYKLLQESEVVVHSLALRVNTVKEAKQDEGIIEGLKLLDKLLSPASLSANREYVRHDIVSVEDRKDPVCIFLFSDQLVFTLTKRRGTQPMRKPLILRLPTSSGYDILENVKYKIYQKVSIESIEFDPQGGSVDFDSEGLVQHKELRDKKDITLLAEIENISRQLEHRHQDLDIVVRKMYMSIQKELEDLRSARIGSPTNLNECCCRFSVTTKEHIERYAITFPSIEKRLAWEKSVKEIRQKLGAVSRTPEYSESLRIPKTLSGMQLSVAATTETGIQLNSVLKRDVWICTSDGFTGHLSLLKVHPKPSVSSNLPIAGCNSRVTTICPVPGLIQNINRLSHRNDRNSLSPKREEVQEELDQVTTARNSPDNIKMSVDMVDKKSPTPEPEEDVDDSSTSSDLSDSGEGTSFTDTGKSSDSPLDSEVKPIRKSRSPRPKMSKKFKSDSKQESTTEDAVKFSENATLTPTSPIDLNTSKSERDKKLLDPQRSTMWLGTEEGIILIFYASDSVRTSRNRQRVNLSSSVNDIHYVDNKVFVCCKNGDFYVYRRMHDGCWSFDSPLKINLQVNPEEPAPVVRRLLGVAGGIWCASQRKIHLFNPNSMVVERTLDLPGNPNVNKSIIIMLYGGHSVWVATENSCKVDLFHATSANYIFEIDIKQAVLQRIQYCDEIIIRHKENCLRITCMTMCKDLLLVGTSAGVIIMIPTPKLNASSTRLNTAIPKLTTLDRGHTGHVRFLITMESAAGQRDSEDSSSSNRLPPIPMGLMAPPVMISNSASSTPKQIHELMNPRLLQNSVSGHHSGSRRGSLNPCMTLATQMKFISGGDGIEEFPCRPTNPEQLVSSGLGELDSINHILIWEVP